MMETTTEPVSSIESLEVLWEFNRSIHHGVMSLDALTRNQLFDANKLRALTADIVRVKARTNAYLVDVIFANEGAIALGRGPSESGPRMDCRDIPPSKMATK